MKQAEWTPELINEAGLKSSPYEHQWEEHITHREDPVRALFWEQGTGKTKPTIDLAAHLYRKFLASSGVAGVDAVMVVAPRGVHTNWCTQEIPAHMPDDIPVHAFHWHSARSGTKEQKSKERRAITFTGLSVVAMTYEGFCTDAGKKFAKEFLVNRSAMIVLDEAHRVKTPSAERSRVMLAAMCHARVRRVLTGTPVANRPFDVYNIMRMLDEHFWFPHGISTYTTFCQTFAVFKQIRPKMGGRPFEKVIGYRNLDLLYNIIAPYSSRVLKENVLDLPPKVYTKLPVELDAQQRKLYEKLRSEYRAMLEAEMMQAGDMPAVEAPHAMTRLMRLQQIACGYTVVDHVNADGEIEPRVVQLFPQGKNPRIKALMDYVEDVPHQGIIWARFREDIDQIETALLDAGMTCVRYDGTVDEKRREQALADFRAGEAQFFVANPAAAGTGLTLTQAKTVIYYSNSFNLVDRLQSEDRAHRIGQNDSVMYVDMYAEDTVDEHVVNTLRNKFDVASVVMKDGLRAWI